ncbi:hypothetical protein ACHOLT_20220 [Desulfitobacterium sp. Sab5]|uniref:hypothetical protein n=1 Tax=Desulfitobacterium nosdiversum TaxID=3375356 RepID=UPI003CFA2D78
MLNFTSYINQDKKRLIIFVVALIITIGIFRAFTFRNIDYKYSGVRYQVGNSGYEEPVNIEIKGKYTIGFFSSFDKFDGKIIIEDKVFDYSDFIQEVDNYKKIPLTLKSGDKSIYGDLFYNNVFKQVTISIRDQEGSSQYSWSNKDGILISAPCKNREQAVEISNILIPKKYRNSNNLE